MKKLLILLAVMLALPFSVQAADDAIEMDVTKVSNTQWLLSVKLTNPNQAYTGFQMDLQLPEGMTFDTSTLTATARLSKVTLQANEKIAGWMRVVGYASTRTAQITGNSGAIYTMAFNSSEPMPVGEYQIVAKNVRVTTSESEDKLLAGLTKTFQVDESEGYMLTYWDGNEVYYSTTLAAGDPIPSIDEPAAKEGYTFCGWGEVPEVMPENNLELHAVWCPIHYKITYTSEGKVIHTEMVPYGSPLPNYQPEPIEGHNFCGWSEAPETMPAHDITLGATWCVRSYKLNYIAMDHVLMTYDVEYGAPLPEFSIKDIPGYKFVGWIDLPETMPAYDLGIEAKFVLRGDVNLDGDINSADVVSVYNFILLGEESDILLINADVNGDAMVNSADVVSIYNIIIDGE